MKFGITPCPNDTFSYRAVIEGAIENPKNLEFQFEDIETLNLKAQNGEFEITKLSFPAYLQNADKYELLDAGAALGMGTGPVLVGGKEGMLLQENSRVIIPGANTTAALLLKFLAKSKFGTFENLHLVPMHFREILDELAENKNKFDFGVLIHEGRFVYEKSGLFLASDLGGFWTEKTSLPVPLGCICVRKDFSHLRLEIESQIRKSLEFAFANKEASYPFVEKHARYLERDVLTNHIFAFVNDWSFDISAIREKLLENLKKCI